MSPPSPVLLAASFAALSLGLAGAYQEPAQGGRKTPRLARPGHFLDDAEACADCHLEIREAFDETAHARVLAGPGLHACEACHGPGERHADEQEPAAITHPGKLPAAEQRALCARCHARAIALHGGPLADLAKAGKRCGDCHRLHAAPRPRRTAPPATRAALDRASRPAGLETCRGCHVSKPANLAGGPHAVLLHEERPDDRRGACELCHGSGAEHAARAGDPAWITRPDRAPDGVATCRSCHAEVDPERFHWPDGGPLLGRRDRRLRCTDCHRVHASRGAAAGAPNLVCARCHAPAFEVLAPSRHRALAAVDHPAGCLACHPGGRAHAASGGRRAAGRPNEGGPAERNRSCLACHARATAHRLAGGAHRGLACLACHEPAEPAGQPSPAAARCGACHPAEAQAFAQASRHPSARGRPACQSCHEPHDPAPPDARRPRARRRFCTRCHRAQRGPFVFPHRADEGEGCLACHLPHGGPNPLLLRTRRARDLCLSCHADLPSFHDQRPGAPYRNCLSCHVKIHGSNRHRFFFR